LQFSALLRGVVKEMARFTYQTQRVRGSKKPLGFNVLSAKPDLIIAKEIKEIKQEDQSGGNARLKWLHSPPRVFEYTSLKLKMTFYL
jgi:hypothetical protein